MKGTISDPPPIPKGIDINPINIPEIFLTIFEICFGLSTNFSLKNIKKSPTIKANIEKNNTRAGVFKLTAKKVPKKTPIKMKNIYSLKIIWSTIKI